VGSVNNLYSLGKRVNIQRRGIGFVLLHSSYIFLVFRYCYVFFILLLLGYKVSKGWLEKTLLRMIVVRYHCGGWSEVVNSCILILSYMVYL
jgi:hypothetical protein